MAERISPQRGHEYFKPISYPDVVLAARLPRSLVQVAAWPETLSAVEQQLVSIVGAPLPTDAGLSIRTGDKLVMTIAPGTFLIEADDLDIAAELARLVVPALGTVTDLAEARVAINVTGARSEWVLSKGLAIDLAATEFPIHRVAQGAIDEIGLIIRRVAAQEFDLYVYQSFARSLWDWLIEASNCD